MKKRKVLNLGHTFAHAYEASLNYSKKLNHGEAVLLGIYSAINFSFKNNFLNQQDFHLITKHIINSKLPFKLKNYFTKKDLEKILSFMTKDKKNDSDKINLILLKRIGSPLINNKFELDKIKIFLKNELT
jgi:3-dehydroquinate synthase/shikimate kinase/3-dehydroquinate synthase